jgi:hypothetical protein
MIAVLAVAAALAVPAASRTTDQPPVLVGWNFLKGPDGCGCLDLDLNITSNGPTDIHIEWGTTSALGSIADSGDVPVGTDGVVHLRWQSAPPPGTYYIRIDAANAAGATMTPLNVYTIGSDGSVHLIPTPQPRPPGPPKPFVTLTVSQTGPITLVVGETLDLQATVTTSPGWLFTVPMSTQVFFTLPGPGLDLVSATPTSGTCIETLRCNFGPVGPSTASSVNMRLRAQTPGTYTLVVQAGSSPVRIDITVVPRIADLEVTPLPGAPRVRVGAALVRTVTIVNHGPQSVSAAQIVVGRPHGLIVHAATRDGGCPAAPLPCLLPPLAPGESATVRLTFAAPRAGRFSIPIGVTCNDAGDNVGTNNVIHYVMTAIKRGSSRSRLP